MIQAGVRLVATAASRIEEAIYIAGRVIPSIRWMKYAALRLGAFIISYFLIVAAIVISVTGWAMADPIIAVVIGIIILWGAVRLVLESVDILAETVPKHIPLDKVIQAIKKIPGVADVHDIHIWTLTSGVYALSAHLLITDQMVSSSVEIIQTTQQTLELHYNITHSTLQLECEKCESCPTGIICEIQRPE